MARTIGPTFLTSSQRETLIVQYLECWLETCSYSAEDAAEEELAWTRNRLEAMPNPELWREVAESGWGITL